MVQDPLSPQQTFPVIPGRFFYSFTLSSVFINFCKPDVHVLSYFYALPERCQSGRMGRSRKPLSRFAGPRVRIPVSPLE
jgi:hypothetical protein